MCIFIDEQRYISVSLLLLCYAYHISLYKGGLLLLFRDFDRLPSATGGRKFTGGGVGFGRKLLFPDLQMVQHVHLPRLLCIL
jgi:hypothetical protein